MGQGILVLGIGNALLSDEGIGGRLAEALAAAPLPDGVRVVDGGTIGLALLPLIEDCAAVLFLDAARLDAEPGTVRLFVDGELDTWLGGRRATPHDVGLADLVSALRLSGSMPSRRALIGIEPQTITLGTALSPPVEAAVPSALEMARSLIMHWASTLG